MKNQKLRGFGLIAATVLVAGAPHAFAQDTPIRAVPQQATDAMQWRKIQCRNVSANFMAYWLDAKHHPVLTPQQGAKPTWAIGKTDAEVKAMLSLPAGVQTIAPVDPQNALWVLGTPEGVQQVVEKVTLLDKPLRQVEVEAQWVRISDADVKALGIYFVQGKGPVGVGFAGTDIETQIAALVTQNRAKIISSPRVTAIIGQTASLTSTGTVPVNLSIQVDKQYSLKLRQVAKADQPETYQVGVSSSVGLIVTPNLNPDGTFKLQLGPLRNIGLTNLKTDVFGKNNQITLADPDLVPTQPVTLKAGQVAAMQGFRWHIAPEGGFGFPNAPHVPALNVLVLVKAHIIRRAGDDELRTAALPR